MSLFSLNLVIIPPLGSLLFPGNGLWKVPGEVPTEEYLIIDGLSDNIVVIRDEWGIPHIYASNEQDLFFAQGYVHAQDRYFSMDMMRRQVRGMLSEILGPSTLSMDKFNLAMGMEYWANKTEQKIREMYNNGTITNLPDIERYTEGVNYYLNTHKHEKPLEYHLLGFEPTEWSLLDTLCGIQKWQDK